MLARALMNSFVYRPKTINFLFGGVFFVWRGIFYLVRRVLTFSVINFSSENRKKISSVT